MKTTVLINVKPFVLNQEVYIITGETVRPAETIKMNDFVEEVFRLSNTYDTNEIHISGAKMFTAGLKKKVEKAEIAKFSENKLNITLV